MRHALLAALVLTASAAGWNGDDYAEVKTLAALPAAARRALNAEGTGTTGIAERGAKYNATDVLDPLRPSRRFLLGGVAGEKTLVALEQGGRGRHMDAFLIVDAPGGPVIKDQWPLDKKPANLAALIETISSYGSSAVRAKKDAERIAREYFKLHVGCGVFEGITDGGAAWNVEGKFGFAGARIEGFRIDKETGRIASPIGPSYADEADMKRQRRRPLK